MGIKKELPIEIVVELSGEEGMTTEDAIIRLRKTFGYGHRKIISWLLVRGVNIDEYLTVKTLIASGEYKKSRVKKAGKCEVCGKRNKHPGFLKMCLYCFKACGNNEVCEEHRISGS